MGRRKAIFTLTPEQVMEALKAENGFISYTARVLGCSPWLVNKYINKYPEIKECLEELRDAKIDFVENKFWELIEQGNTAAIIFFLKTQAYQRGYTQRREVKHEGKMEIKHEGTIKIESMTNEQLDEFITGSIKSEECKPKESNSP